MSIGTNGSREFSNSHVLANFLQTTLSTTKLIEHEGHLQAKGCGLGMNAMASANHGGELMLLSPFGNDFAQMSHILEQDVDRRRHLNPKGRINQITAGQPVMQPSRCAVIDIFSHVGGEGNHIVIEGALQLTTALNGKGGPFFHLTKVLLGHQTLLNESLSSQQFNLEPNFELPLLRPDVPHGGT